MPRLEVFCPECGAPVKPVPNAGIWQCQGCLFTAAGGTAYVSLAEGTKDRTADHYSLQWGEQFGYLEFLNANLGAKAVMPSSQLGWDELFQEIRDVAAEGPVAVYDAACGFGGIAAELLSDGRALHLAYVGADIHASLPVIADKIRDFASRGLLIRWDITRPVPIAARFDYVLCRASLHHTPDPPAAFATLCGALKSGGKIAISLYRKKGSCREASDDALRSVISRLPPDVAFDTCRQFTVLGKALEQVTEQVQLSEDLPLLGIRRGQYGVHELLYYHFLKCFYNPKFGDRYSTLVNYDWYHPPFAYRYDLSEVTPWFDANGIEILNTRSIAVQHFIVGIKRGR